MRLLAYFVCFLLLVSLPSLAQHAEQYSFTHYGLADGLASNIVSNTVQDSRGFMWLSTNNGLQRFDGNRFLSFRSRPGDPAALPADEVNQIFLDSKQRLWVLTADNRVGTFNTENFTYHEVPVRKQRSERLYVDKTMLETADGRLLLHFRKTKMVYALNPAAGVFEPTHEIPVPRNWDVNYMQRLGDSKKYILATDSGFVVYNSETGKLSYRDANLENEPLITHCGQEKFLNYFFVDSRNRLFFEQWPKTSRHPSLQVFDLTTNRKEAHDFTADYALGYHQIKAALEQRNGRLWIYGLPFLAEYLGQGKPMYFLKRDYNKERDLKFNQVFSLYEDRQQNVWVCTDNGVYLFNPDAQFFHNYTLTTPKRFSVEGRSQSALQLANGEIWIGYRDLGLHRYDAKMNELPLPAAVLPLQENKSVWDIHQHSKTGAVWLALQGGSVIVYDTATKKAELLSPAPFEQRAVTQVTEDEQGNLWLGTQAGNLVKWNFAQAKNNPSNAFSLFMRTGIIEKMVTDSRGLLWIAAVGSGVLVIDPLTDKIVRQLSRENRSGYSLWNNNPKDILQYNDTLVVVASGALNLVSLKDYTVRHLSNRDGLPSNTVQSLAKDAAGRLWLGTMNGLCVADIQQQQFSVYNQNDGLLNDHFNVAGAHSLRNGQLLFMSAESFLLFDPTRARKQAHSPTLYITDVRLWDRSLPVDSLAALEQLQLSYKAYVTIEFSALNYNKLNKLEYYYQLEGLDTAWVRSNDDHRAVYSFLPPGGYTFRLRTRDVSGEWNPGEASLRIFVTPPFYKSWWFVLSLLLLGAAVLYVLYRERIRRLVTLHNIRSDIANHLHKDVSTTLNNINVLSQIARMKADRDIDRSKELIDEISGKSYNMMVSMDEILWSIDPGNDTMEKTLLRIEEFTKTLETGYGITIEMIVHQKVKDLRLDMRVRHDFFVICKAALQQLAQGAIADSIMMDIDLAWSKIVIKILANGTGTEEKAPALAELKKAMEEKATAMQASLVFETGSRDTSIILSIPVRPHTLTPYTIFSSRR